MTTVPFDSFLSEVVPFVPEVPEFVALNAVRNAAFEFCEKSHYWQVDVAAFDATAGTANYAIAVPADTQMVEVIEGWYNGSLLYPKAVEELTRLYGKTDWRTQPGTPVFYTREIDDMLNLVPVPQTSLAAAISLRVALAPTRTATTVSSLLFDRYVEEIARGARARLYGTPGQPYSDATAAEVYRRLFKIDCALAAIRANRGKTRVSVGIERNRFP